MNEWVEIFLSFAVLFGLAEVFKWRFMPRIPKERAEAEKNKAVEDAVQAALQLKDSLIGSLVADVKRLQEEMTALRSMTASRDRSLRAFVMRLKTAVEKHIASWRAAVEHPDVDAATRDRIIGRVEPLPDGWDREDGE